MNASSHELGTEKRKELEGGGRVTKEWRHRFGECGSGEQEGVLRESGVGTRWGSATSVQNGRFLDGLSPAEII